VFSVRWVRSALDGLANVWLEADSAERRAITAATLEFDSRLQLEPQSEGESRPHHRRIMFVAPLGIIFEINESEHLVRVLRVWRFDKPD
jgi:hypothetical protein